MANRDKRNRFLQFKGRQWQFVKRLPKPVADVVGKQFFVKNLGTSDLLEARRMRDRLELEVKELPHKQILTETAILQDLQNISDPEERANVEGILQDYYAEPMEEREKGLGVAWFQRVTGQVTPVSMNLERYIQERPAAETTQHARRSALSKLEAWRQGLTVQNLDRQTAGLYVSH